MEATSWSNVAKMKPLHSQPDVSPAGEIHRNGSLAVLDANAIISGTLLHTLATELCTTNEVLLEVKDKQSRHFLATLPFGISIRVPSEESIVAVAKFARATGEIHSLSTADLRLIALAHTLHRQLIGPKSLLSTPLPLKISVKQKVQDLDLPGWGAKGGTWEELDKLDEPPPAAENPGLARNTRLAEHRSLGLREKAGPATRPAPDASRKPFHARPSRPGAWSQHLLNNEDLRTSAEGSSLGAREADAKQTSRDMDVLPECIQNCEDVGRADLPSAEEPEDCDGMQSGSCKESDRPSVLENEQQEAEPLDLPEKSKKQTVAATGSRVSIVTADFAMQNVILQMGLHLQTPDGRKIRNIKRWVLRCSACFKITKEMERLFCPQCGNAALQKVQLLVDANGSEQYGVPTKHNLRGTKFSLPRPKGGKHAKNPVLREDMMLQRMPKQMQNDKPADPFAPEYNSTTWHDSGKGSSSPYHKGFAAVLASWKHNPNERKLTRTNRRK